jgi:carboxylesterase
VKGVLMAIHFGKRWRKQPDAAGAPVEGTQEVLPAPIPLPVPAHPAAAPAPGGFRIEARRVGILLVHGLTSTPLSMEPLGMALARHGMDVEGILLPGHGSRPEDLIGVAWEDWYASVRAAVADMRTRYDRVFVCGQSLGGSLALHLAAEENVHGVITLAGVAYLRDWRLRFLPLVARFRRWRRSPGNDIARPGTQDTGSYDRMPFTAIQELLELSKLVRQELPQVTAPALVMQSAVDHVVHAKNADYIHDRLGSRRKELVRLQNSYHVISLDNDFELVVDRIVRFVRRFGFER